MQEKGGGNMQKTLEHYMCVYRTSRAAILEVAAMINGSVEKVNVWFDLDTLTSEAETLEVSVSEEVLREKEAEIMSTGKFESFKILAK